MGKTKKTAAALPPLDQLLSSAMEQLAANHPMEALAFARQATQVAPQDARTFALCGYALLSHGDWFEAATELERSVNLDASDLRIVLALAGLKWRMAAAEEACTLAEFVIRNSDNQPALARQANALKQRIDVASRSLR